MDRSSSRGQEILRRLVPAGMWASVTSPCHVFVLTVVTHLSSSDMKLQAFSMGMLCSSDISKVTSCMQHALSARNPRTRYSAGWDAKLFWIPLSYVPTRVADFIMGLLLPLPKDTWMVHIITDITDQRLNMSRFGTRHRVRINATNKDIFYVHYHWKVWKHAFFFIIVNIFRIIANPSTPLNNTVQNTWSLHSIWAFYPLPRIILLIF